MKKRKQHTIKHSDFDSRVPRDNRKRIIDGKCARGRQFTGSQSFRDNNDLEAAGIMVRG